MATVRYELKNGAQPTEEQIKQIEEAAKRPIVYDEDAPKLTPEQLTQFKKAAELKRQERQKQVVSLRVSSETMTKAKALGKGYSGVLSRMLDYCLNSPEIIKKCL